MPSGTVDVVNGSDGFDGFLKSNRDRLVVVDFYATWCGPCKMMAPKFERMAKEFTDVAFAKVDIDEEEDVASRYEIALMPTFILIKNGVQVDKIEGTKEESLLEAIKKNK